MSRAARTQNSVSLFPFLAVLVCAMGALIFLLLVTTRRIRDNARAEAIAAHQVETEATEPDPQPPVGPTNVIGPVPPLPAPHVPDVPEPPPEPTIVVVPSREPDPNDELRRTIAELEGLVADKTDESSRITTAIAEVEDELAAARSLAARTSSALGKRKAEVDRLLAQAEELQRRRAKAENEIRDLQVELREARARRDEEDSKFAFVPYDGTKGTRRRPIYIECTGRGLKFVPEGVLLEETDLIGFTYRINPLLAGTRALVAHWDAIDRRDDPTAERPYVLLLVRPDGAGAYYAARKMLDMLGETYGYELVPDDFEIALPEADPIAKRIVRDETQRLIAERDAIVANSATLSALAGGGLGGGRIGGGTNDGTPGGRIGGFPGRDGERGEGAGGTPARPVGIGTAPRVGIRGSDGDGSSDPRLRGGQREPFGASPRPGGPLVRTFEPTQPSPSEKPGFGDPIDSASTADREGTSKRGGESTPVASGRAGDPLGPPIDVGSTNPSGAGRPWDGGLIDTEAASTDDAFPKIDEASPLDGPTPDDVFSRATHGHSSSRGGHAAVRRGGIGIEKEVVVDVLDDRIVIGGRYTLPYERGQTAQQLSEAVLGGVDRVVAGWDAPPRGFHWVPGVRFRVSTGGNVHYERIRSRIERLGVKSKVEYELQARGDAAKRG